MCIVFQNTNKLDKVWVLCSSCWNIKKMERWKKPVKIWWEFSQSFSSPLRNWKKSSKDLPRKLTKTEVKISGKMYYGVTHQSTIWTVEGSAWHPDKAARCRARHLLNFFHSLKVKKTSHQIFDSFCLLLLLSLTSQDYSHFFTAWIQHLGVCWFPLLCLWHYAHVSYIFQLYSNEETNWEN